MENEGAVGGAKRRFNGALRVRHQAEDVALAIRDSGDGRKRAIGVGVEVMGASGAAIGANVAKNYLPIALEFSERRYKAIVRVGLFPAFCLQIRPVLGMGRRTSYC